MKKNISSFVSKAMWPVLFITILLKYAYYGYRYYPILDDNNMYGVFRLYGNTFHDVILGFRMYTTRPAAVFLDAYLWARLWNNLGAALIIMTVLHFLTCFFVYKIFEKCRLKIGLPLIAIFALLPFGSEATYWLSASSRVVVGIFFLALSLYLLCLYFENENDKGKNYLFLALFFITHLVSLGFYEQVIALGFFAVILVFLANWKSLKSKWIAILPRINFFAIAFWYKLFSHEGNMASRGQIVSAHYLAHTKDVIRAIYDVWKMSAAELYHTGLIKSFQTIISDKSYIFLLLIILASIAAFFISNSESAGRGLKINVLKFLLGAFLFAVPYAPFFAMQLIWICNRNIFLSFIGLGLILEAVLNFLSANKALFTARSVLVSLMVFILLVSNVYELSYYRNIGTIDNEILTKISQMPEASEYLKGNKTLVLLNAKFSYADTTSKRLEDCTNADWALTGALSAHNSIIKLRYATPVAPEFNLPLSKEMVNSSILLGIDDSRNIFPVKIAKQTGDRIYLSNSSGKEFGQLELLPDNVAVFHLDK